MKHPVPILMTLPNLNRRVEPDVIYSFIESNAENINTFWIDPEKTRGRLVAASIEYVILLGVIGSVASIASLLWMAYDKFIGQKKQSNNDDAGLYISIEYPDGTQYNFWLGKEYKNRKIFIQEFTKRVTELQEHPDTPTKTKKVISSIVHEDLWTQRK